MAGLRVDSREGLLRGGETGPAIVPGDPEKSTLIKAVQHADGFPRMPRGRAKLAAQDIDALAQWIRDGAVWPAAAAAAPAPAVAHERVITAEQRAYWAFRPLAKPEPPDRAPHRLAAHRHRSLHPRASRAGRPGAGRPADKLTLLRRATLDLTGLPPSPDDVDAFLKDQSPDAFEKVVDRLLASPQYGEAWGRHVARRGALRGRRLPQPRSDGPRLQSVPERAPLSRLGDPRVQRRPAVRPVRDGATGRRSARRPGAPASPAGARLPRPRARGTTTTARSRSCAPTSATIASMR